MDNLKSLIKSSSVFDLPPEDKKINNLMFATAPSEDGRKQRKDQDCGASTVSLPTLSEDTQSRRMS